MKTICFHLLTIGFCLIFSTGKSQSITIKSFIVKESLLKNDKLAIIATDSTDKPIEQVNGTFQFSVNGFRQELKFHDGVAVYPQPIDKSTFVYLKHLNGEASTARLYYVLKRDSGLNPIKISWMVMALIPALVIIIASMFRKFLVFAIIIILGLFFFNTSNGLSLPTFLETIFDGLKSFI